MVAVRKSTVFLLTLVIALALLGSSGGDAGQEIDIKGKITEVIVGDDGDVTGILVEGNPGDGADDKGDRPPPGSRTVNRRTTLRFLRPSEGGEANEGSHNWGSRPCGNVMTLSIEGHRLDGNIKRKFTGKK